MSSDIGLDKGWIITCSGFVFVMHVGLGLMEIGSTRRKHSNIIWYKILLNIIITTFCWFLVGFAWAFGYTRGSFLGAETYYVGDEWDADDQSVGFIPSSGYRHGQFSHYLWRVSIASLATTIATGVVSERISMKAVYWFNYFMNFIILPFVFAWTFAGGYLFDDIGYRDMAGCFIIFGVGATAGLTALLLMGPRYNKYGTYPPVLLAGRADVRTAVEVRPTGSSEGTRNLPSVGFDKIRKEPVVTESYAPATTGSAGPADEFSAANIAANRRRQLDEEYEHYGITDYGKVILGAILFFIGFIFYNAGSAQGLSVLYPFAERAAVNTILGAMGGGITTLWFHVLFIRKKKSDKETYVTIARAAVAGMVATCADVFSYAPWAGIVLGICGAVGYLFWSKIFTAARWDDPAEFVPMFFGAGIAGVFAAAFLNKAVGIFYENATEGEILIWQLLGLAILIGWTVFVSLICFWIAKKLNFLRVGLQTEVIGYDFIDGARHIKFQDDHNIHYLQKKKLI